jgi:LysR family transcriptional regulator, nitrogen assimilation regulatory protein
MSSFDLRRLRYFLAVAELGSVTRAASELHLAQPALSHQIRLLEEEIGVQLFARGPQGVRLTELGRTLADESRRVLSGVRLLRDRICESALEPQGDVAVGLAQTIGPVLALPLLELAALRLPRVRIRIRELMSSDIPELLRSESIDFAFSYAVPAGRGIRSTSIFSEDLFLVGTSACARQYFRKPDLNEVAFSELKGVPLYLSARLNGFREELERIARGRRIKLKVVAEVDSVSVRKEIALRGAGFTVLSGATISKEISQKDVFAARNSNPHIRRKVCYVRQTGSALSRGAEAVAALIGESLSLVAKQDMWPGVILPASGIPKLV